MRCMRVVLLLGVLASAAGCGSGAARPAPPREAHLLSGNCQSLSGTTPGQAGGSPLGRAISQSCLFVFSDGQRFRCQADIGSTPTVQLLERTQGCQRLASLELSFASQTVVARIGTVQRCLAAARLHSSGAPVLPPSPPGSTSADGELVVSTTPPALIAFYTDTAKARRLEPAVAHSIRRVGGKVVRHGPVTVAFTGARSKRLRRTVEKCAFG